VAAQSFFGLDIGTSSIKVVWLEKIGQAFKLLAANSISSPARGMLTESTLDQDALAQAINKVQHDAKISTNKVVSALPESQIFTRVIEMPVLTDNELASAIRWEADQYLPIPANEVSLAWQVLAKPDKVTANSRMQVLLIAAPLSLVEKHMAILTKANLKPLSVETENLAIVRALVDRNSPTSLILSLGAFTTDICIARSGILVSTRSIATAGSSMTRAIAAELNFELAQAEEYKKTYGLLEDQLDGKVFAAIRPVFEIIIGEIKKSMTLYQSKFTDDLVKQMIVAGGGANLPGVAIYLTRALGLEVQIGDPWFNLVENNKQAQSAEARPVYTVATGLAKKVL